MDFIKQLAQKKYDEKVIKLATMEQAALNKYLKIINYLQKKILVLRKTRAKH